MNVTSARAICDYDSNSDILWRNDNGTMAEWLMNGNTITQSTPSSGAAGLARRNLEHAGQADEFRLGRARVKVEEGACDPGEGRRI